MKRFRVAALAIFFVLASILAPAPVAAAKGGGGGKTSATINYVALGDSIATGTVTYWSNITPYTKNFQQSLQSYYGSKYTVKLTSLAQDGETSMSLLTKLKSNTTVRSAVQTANVITISIGGNNLMQAATIPGFTEIDEALAAGNTAQFQSDWPEIINQIKSMNTKNAKIIVMTVYNPYNSTPPSGYSADTGLHDLTDGYLKDINGAISSNTSIGYRVADVYTEFDAKQPSSMGTITYFYPALWSYLLRNPHPNATGQGIIANLHRTVFLNY